MRPYGSWVTGRTSSTGSGRILRLLAAQCGSSQNTEPGCGELGDRGAELVWATSWGRVAMTWIAPRLGLPEYPVIEVPRRRSAFGWSPKIDPIQRWVGDRPLVWIDDQLGGKEPGWAEERRGDGIPTLIIQPRPGRGLERAHVEEVLSWLIAASKHGAGRTADP